MKGLVRKLGVVVAVTTVATMGLLAPAAMADVAVTTTSDGGAGSLRDAVEVAVSSNETVVVPAGTYKLTLGPLEIAKNIAVVGSGPGATVIEGNGKERVLEVISRGEVTLQGLTVRGGIDKGGIAQAAGILDKAGHLVLRNVVVAENLADATKPGEAGGIAEGAGLAMRNEERQRLTIIDSVFRDNVVDASGRDGKSGGLAEGGAINAAESGAVDISGSTFVRNKAISVGGTNGSADGGAIYLARNSEAGSLTNSTLAENFVEGGNSALGGGIIVGIYKPFEIDRVTIVGNKVHATKAVGRGGGIEGAGSVGGPLRVIGSTIVGNSADHGGNVQVGDSTFFGDTVIAGGISAAGEENCGKGTTIVSLGFNLESTNQCGLTAPGDVVNTDPQLGPLADNGGLTQTMLPAQTSPLVDAGASFGLATDLRGAPRPADDPRIANSTAPGADGAEIGAVELPAQPPLPAKPAPPAPTAPQPAPPATVVPNATLGKVTTNARAGTATVTVSFSSPATGTLKLSGTGLKASTRRLSGATSAKLVLVATGKAHDALVAKGSRKVGFVVAFTAAGGATQRSTGSATLRRQDPRRR
jgi:hypothetical protein